MHLSSPPQVAHIPPKSSFSFDHSNDIWWGVQIVNLSVMQSYPISCYEVQRQNFFLSPLFTNTHSLCSSLNVRNHISHTKTDKSIILYKFWISLPNAAWTLLVLYILLFFIVPFNCSTVHVLQPLIVWCSTFSFLFLRSKCSQKLPILKYNLSPSLNDSVKVYKPHIKQQMKLYVEIKCQLDATDDFYCRSYCLLNMLRASLCPSSGAQEYYAGGCCLWYLVL